MKASAFPISEGDAYEKPNREQADYLELWTPGDAGAARPKS